MTIFAPHKPVVVWRLALICAGLVVSACGTAQQDQTPTIIAVPASETPAEGAMIEFDQMFIDMMVPHHQSAIEMGQIALDRAEHAEIKTMAEQIIAMQQEEITQLRDWRADWYGSSETPPMSAMPILPGMNGMEHEAGAGDVVVMDLAMDVEALRNAPEPFDLAFIDAMIPHHTMAIEAGQMALDQATHPEFKEMAQQIIEAQQKEIAQLQEWRQAWYPDAAAMATTTP